MGDNLWPPNSDPELTRSISNSPPSSSSSAISLDAPKELRLCSSHAKLSASTGWTNEKHNMYLRSLETSFVNRLYDSMHLRDRHSQKNSRGTHSSQELSFKTQNYTEQLMIVQDGCLQKINLQGNETLMESTADSHVTVESRWICHSASAGKSCNVSSPKTTLTSKKIYASARSSEHLVGSTTEVSGQNFVDADHDGKLRNASVPKRLKRAAPDASRNDQIVPAGNFYTEEVSMVHNVLSERYEDGHKKKPDLHYFLGGS